MKLMSDMVEAFQVYLPVIVVQPSVYTIIM